MRSDLVGMPVVVIDAGVEVKGIFVIRATWLVPDPAGSVVEFLLESEQGRLTVKRSNRVRMLVPQVMSSYSATSLTELFPDLLMKYGRREIVAIWSLSLGFDGPLREKIKYGIVAYEEGKEGELAAMRAQRDAGGFDPEPEPTLRSRLKEELRAEILAELAAPGELYRGQPDKEEGIERPAAEPKTEE
jgi:hypothetical protein